MLFNSWEFLVLLALAFGAYYLPVVPRWRKLWQVLVLLVGSTVFYSWERPELVILLGFSCVLNAVAAERIIYWKLEEHASGGAAASRRSLWWLRGTVAANLLLLSVFKYAGFLASLLPEGMLGEETTRWLLEIPLPVGISFYTFQGISLVVDVYRRDMSPHTEEVLSRRGIRRISSIRDLSFYISFFPQLVAGPIVKAREFVDQIGSKELGAIDWRTVRQCLITGYFLKVFVADNLAEHTAALSLAPDKVEGIGLINGMCLVYGYSLQIFADFAGYSLIALGLGALFGYRLPPNFNFPYLSRSITEFWRRWHLSLSSWLRDYLYIPLGGNRRGSGRTYFNLFFVMFLGGLWHGAAWNFAIWGLLHGCFLAAERFWSRRPPRTESAPTKARQLGLLASVVRWIWTFHLVSFLWLTFLMPDTEGIIVLFRGMASQGFILSGPPVFSLGFYGTFVVLYHCWGWLREHRKPVANKLLRSPLEPLCHGVMLFLIMTNPGAPRGFIYFQF